MFASFTRNYIDPLRPGFQSLPLPLNKELYRVKHYTSKNIVMDVGSEIDFDIDVSITFTRTYAMLWYAMQ